MNNKRLAFTLIELLVVIAIVGILSGLIIVGMSSSVRSANIAKAQIFSNSLRNSLLMNLVSEWKFDGSGIVDGNPVTAGTAYLQDSWSSGNTCTIAGTAPLVYSGSNCIYGSCLKFNGTGDYLDCGNTASVNISGALTVSAWIKTADTTMAAIVRHKGGIGDAAGYTFFIESGYVKLRLEGPVDINDDTVISDSKVNNNSWHFVVGMRRIDPKEMIVYVDGIIKTKVDPTTDISASTPLYIGGPYYNLYLNGYLDDVRIHNASTAASQIKEQYYAGLNALVARGEITKEEYLSRIKHE